MALVATRTIPFPQIPPWTTGGSPAYNVLTFAVNGASEKFGCVFCPPKTGSIRKVGWRTGTVSTVGTNPLDVRIETVDTATGLPSGTLWAANTNVAHTLLTSDDAVWLTSNALTADAVITNTDTPIAVVIANPATNFSNMQVASLVGCFTGASGRPYGLMFTTAWSLPDNVPVLAVEYSDGTYEYIPGLWAISNAMTLNVTTATNPDEVGIRFSLPFRARMRGFWVVYQVSALTADFEMVFYDAAGVQARTKAMDPDLLSGLTYRYIEEYWSSPVDLDIDTFYRLTFRPVTTNAANANYFQCDSVSLMNATPWGQNCYWTERSDAGAWTDITTRYAIMGVLLDQLSDDAASAGGVFVKRRFIA
jgi:hypothetical protein